MTEPDPFEATRRFRDHVMEAPDVFDPEQVHREFASGAHGRKIDFDAIPTESELFAEWTDIVTQKIRLLYASQEAGTRVLLSVANGTNRLVGPVTEQLAGEGLEWVPLQTEKVNSNQVALTAGAAEAFEELRPGFVLVLEDVGTTGNTSATAALAAQEAGAEQVEVLGTWQRTARLERLNALDITYHSVIRKILPTYQSSDCLASGPCAWGWELIEHDQ